MPLASLGLGKPVSLAHSVRSCCLSQRTCTATLHEDSQCLCFLELAEDPARCATSPSRRRCSSAWATLALKAWTKDLLLSELHFDLCHFAVVASRPTRAVTNLPLGDWNGKMCVHSEHPKAVIQDLAVTRRPEAMLQAIATSLVRTLHYGSHGATRNSHPRCAYRSIGSLSGTGASSLGGSRGSTRRGGCASLPTLAGRAASLRLGSAWCRYPCLPHGRRFFLDVMRTAAQLVGSRCGLRRLPLFENCPLGGATTEG